MGITLSTAITAASNKDVIIDCAGPDDAGKFSGWISLPNGRPLISTCNIFSTGNLAKKHMLDLIEELKVKYRV